jgi:MFS family permease
MWLLGLVIMVDQMDQNLVRGVLSQIKAEFHLTDTAAGLLVSSFILVNGLITVPAGYLADRWNRTRTIGHTVVAWSGISALTAAAWNFPALVTIRAMLGFGQAITEPSANSLISDYYSTEERGRAFSIQQVLTFIGFGLGIGVGGAVGSALGWRWAFVIVGGPGALIAIACYRLREPRRGSGDRQHLGYDDDDGHDEDHALFEEGFRRFLTDMYQGLLQDLRTILAIPTMKYALVGVGTLLFTITGIGAWLPQFHQRFHGLSEEKSTALVATVVILAGIPGVLIGGRVADRYMARVKGARVVIPAYCIWIGNALFMASYVRMPLLPSMGLELIGFFAIVMSIPALRAGLADAVPAHLRGAGFGAFNLVSVLFGAALAPIVVGALADIWNLRWAFLIVSPPVFVGAYILFRARDHLDEDAAKIFEAVLRAIQADQERQAELEQEA